MKSSFKKGDKVKTTEKAAKQIKKGRLAEPMIESGMVVSNEHFGRWVKVELLNKIEVSTQPEHIELIK